MSRVQLINDFKVKCLESIPSLVDRRDVQDIMISLQSKLVVSICPQIEYTKKLLPYGIDKPIDSVLSLVCALNKEPEMSYQSTLERSIIKHLCSLLNPDESSNVYESLRQAIHSIPSSEKSKYNNLLPQIYNLYIEYGWSKEQMRFYRDITPIVFIKNMAPILILIIEDNIPQPTKSKHARKEIRKNQYRPSTRAAWIDPRSLNIESMGINYGNANSYSMMLNGEPYTINESYTTTYTYTPQPVIKLSDPGSKENTFTQLETLLSIPVQQQHDYTMSGGDRLAEHLINLLTKKYVVVPSDFNIVNNLVIQSLSNGRENVYVELSTLVGIIAEQTQYQENYIMDMHKDPIIRSEDVNENYEIDMTNDDPVQNLYEIISILSNEVPDIVYIQAILDDLPCDLNEDAQQMIETAIDIAAEKDYQEILELLCEFQA